MMILTPACETSGLLIKILSPEAFEFAAYYDRIYQGG